MGKDNKYRVSNDFQKSISELIKDDIDESKLYEIGFHKGNFPEMFFTLNEETALVLAYAEGKWYGAIHQFQGLKPPMERVYIPKDIVSMNDVFMLIRSLSETEKGSHIPKQSDSLEQRLKDINQPIRPNPPLPPNDRIIREDGKGLVKPKNWKK